MVRSRLIPVAQREMVLDVIAVAAAVLLQPAPTRQPGPTPNRVRLGLLAVLLMCATATLLLWPHRADGRLVEVDKEGGGVVAQDTVMVQDRV